MLQCRTARDKSAHDVAQFLATDNHIACFEGGNVSSKLANNSFFLACMRDNARWRAFRRSGAGGDGIL